MRKPCSLPHWGVVHGEHRDIQEQKLPWPVQLNLALKKHDSPALSSSTVPDPPARLCFSLGASPAPKLPLGTNTAMEESTGHPPSPSAGSASALGDAGKHPQPCFTPKQSTEPKTTPKPAAWTCSQPLHSCTGEPGSPIQLFQVLQQEELFSFSFFSPFFSLT